MKAFLSKIIIIALLQGLSFSLMAHVVLDYPKGGETFSAGSNVTIQWHVAIPHNTLNYDLYFSSDGGMTWDTIQLNIPAGQLSYVWQVPGIATTQGRVSVIQDNSDQDYQDESMNFTIQLAGLPPAINMAAQNATYQCNSNSQQSTIQTWLNNHGGATVTSFCGDLVWTNDFTALSDLCGATGSALVTFTAMDACGSTVTSAILGFVDTQAPLISVPASDLTLECNGSSNLTQINSWLSHQGGAMASDGCSIVSWTDDFTGIPDTCSSTITRVVTFTALDDCGNESFTQATLRILGTSSVPDFSNSGIKIYPNPVHGILKIEFDQNEIQALHLALVDMYGKLLWASQEKAKEIFIPVDKYTSGVYFLQIETEQGTYSRKVIIE